MGASSNQQSLLANSLAPALLQQLATGDVIGTIQAIRDTYSTRPIKTSWFGSFFAKPSAPPTPKLGTYAWLTLADLLDEQFEPQQVADAHPIPTDSDYVAELNELGCVLRWVEQVGTVDQFEDRLAELLLGMAYMAAEHIRDNSNNYPTNSISAKIWMDGASLRGFCQTLTDYELRGGNSHEAVDAAYYKARITLAIMGHYPSEVGPDMVQVG